MIDKIFLLVLSSERLFYLFSDVQNSVIIYSGLIQAGLILASSVSAIFKLYRCKGVRLIPSHLRVTRAAGGDGKGFSNI